MLRFGRRYVLIGATEQRKGSADLVEDDRAQQFVRRQTGGLAARRVSTILMPRLQNHPKEGISPASVSRSQDILRQAVPRGALLPCRMEAYLGSFTA